MSEKFKILRVTITKDYYIPMYDGKVSKLNGWSLQEVVDDWFKNNNLDSYHATRDGHEIGNSTKFISHEVVENEE